MESEESDRDVSKDVLQQIVEDIHISSDEEGGGKKELLKEENQEISDQAGAVSSVPSDAADSKEEPNKDDTDITDAVDVNVDEKLKIDSETETNPISSTTETETFKLDVPSSEQNIDEVTDDLSIDKSESVEKDVTENVDDLTKIDNETEVVEPEDEIENKNVELQKDVEEESSTNVEESGTNQSPSVEATLSEETEKSEDKEKIDELVDDNKRDEKLSDEPNVELKDENSRNSSSPSQTSDADLFSNNDVLDIFSSKVVALSKEIEKKGIETLSTTSDNGKTRKKCVSKEKESTSTKKSAEKKEKIEKSKKNLIENIKGDAIENVPSQADSNSDKEGEKKSSRSASTEDSEMILFNNPIDLDEMTPDLVKVESNSDDSELDPLRNSPKKYIGANFDPNEESVENIQFHLDLMKAESEKTAMNKDENSGENPLEIPQVILDQLDLKKFTNLVIDNEDEKGVPTPAQVDTSKAEKKTRPLRSGSTSSESNDAKGSKSKGFKKDVKLIEEIRKRIERRKSKQSREEDESSDVTDTLEEPETPKNQSRIKKTPLLKSNKTTRTKMAEVKPTEPKPTPIKGKKLPEPKATPSRAKFTEPRPTPNKAKSAEPKPTLNKAKSAEPKPTPNKAKSAEPKPTPKKAKTSEPKPTPNKAKEKVTVKKTDQPKPSSPKVKEGPRKSSLEQDTGESDSVQSEVETLVSSRPTRKIKLTDKYRKFVAQEKNIHLSSSDDEMSDKVLTKALTKLKSETDDEDVKPVSKKDLAKTPVVSKKNQAKTMKTPVVLKKNSTKTPVVSKKNTAKTPALKKELDEMTDESEEETSKTPVVSKKDSTKTPVSKKDTSKTPTSKKDAAKTPVSKKDTAAPSAKTNSAGKSSENRVPTIKIHLKRKKDLMESDAEEPEKPTPRSTRSKTNNAKAGAGELVGEIVSADKKKATKPPAKKKVEKEKKIVQSEPPKAKRAKKELISESELSDDDDAVEEEEEDYYDPGYDEDKDPDFALDSDSDTSDILMSDSFNESKDLDGGRTVHELVQDVFKVMPSWNIHILPNSSSICLVQISRGVTGVPMLKKCIEMDAYFNVKVYVHQIHYKKYDGVYDSEDHFVQLLQLVDSM